MALQNFQYDTIMREYSRRQSRSRRELEERRQEAFLKVPRLAQIDEEVASLSAARARSLLGGSGGSLDELKKEIADLSAKGSHSLNRTAIRPIIWNRIISVRSARTPIYRKPEVLLLQKSRD